MINPGSYSFTSTTGYVRGRKQKGNPLLASLMQRLPAAPKTKRQKLFEEVLYREKDHFEKPTEYINRTLEDGVEFYAINNGFGLLFNNETKTMIVCLTYSSSIASQRCLDSFGLLKEAFPNLPYDIQNKTVVITGKVNIGPTKQCKEDANGYPIVI